MSKGKFEGLLARVAYDITLNGFASDEFGTVEDSTGWNALVEMDSGTVDQIEDDELRERFAVDYGASIHGGALVWIRADSYGFVDVVMWGHDSGVTSGTDRVSREWDEFTQS